MICLFIFANSITCMFYTVLILICFVVCISDSNETSGHEGCNAYVMMFLCSFHINKSIYYGRPHSNHMITRFVLYVYMYVHVTVQKGNLALQLYISFADLRSSMIGIIKFH